MNKKLLLDSNLHLLKKKRKKIVLCHGVFDHFHYGHFLHFKSAKKWGDLLVVSITDDLYVNKGPNRPFNDINKRLSIISELSMVDFVLVSKNFTAVEVIKKIKPDFYAKGPDYKDKNKDITGNILYEKKATEQYGGKIIFTNDFTSSSSSILNNYFIKYNEDQLKLISDIKSKYNVNKIISYIEKFKNLKVIILGEPIIDKYIYTNTMGLGSKSPIISSKFLKEEIFAGGSLVIANHLASLGCKVSIILPISKKIIDQKYIYKKLDNKIKIYFFNSYNWKIPEKIRYLTLFRSQKIFELNKLPDMNLDNRMQNKIVTLLKSKTKINDLLLVSDFGHEFINRLAIQGIENAKIFKSLNVQTNSSNLGFNLISKYKKYDHVVLDEKEMRLGCANNKLPLEDLINYALSKKILKSPFSLTLGEKGGFYISKKNKIFRSPVFFDEPLDTMGSGDAYFAISSLLTKIKCPEVLIPFISNCYAGLKTRIIGNNPVKISDLVKTLSSILA
jgi:rfaE bifunctional protein nucleotidyltransferase chain/domain